MKLIKLNAIDSTNDFLKELSKDVETENFTTVMAENQTKGKGQMGSVWVSEVGKNLTMSTLIKGLLLNPEEVFHLNVMVSISIIQVLRELNIPNLAIKWPNDIMSDTKKIAGILIENRFKSDKSIESIVGIGMNVNQNNFNSLPNATSLGLIMSKDYDVNQLVDLIVFKIIENSKLISTTNVSILWEIYYKNLFKKEVLMPFEDTNKNTFFGFIIGVSIEGRLQVRLQDNAIKTFGIKEIKMVY